MFNLPFSTEPNTLTTQERLNAFGQDIIRGLSAKEKYLDSKYFYDEIGDALFQQIMQSEEYYLTNCELEILQKQSVDIAQTFLHYHQHFDLIELGAGDATKSIYLLQKLLKASASFTYYPVDISQHAIEQLEDQLPKRLPSLSLEGLNGEYLTMLDHFSGSSRPKIVLFMGANIGNIPPKEVAGFIQALRARLNPNDLLFIGFDLKKDPRIILAAYHDKKGYTKAFNLHLLERINNTFNANFQLQYFEHYPTYDPQTGSTKSYLISTIDQEIWIADLHCRLFFRAGEPIFMEISQKYHLAEIQELAKQNGFKPTNHFFDGKKWFVDSLWVAE